MVHAIRFLEFALLAGCALAQEPNVSVLEQELPSDLASYLDSIESNTAIAAVVQNVLSASQVQSVVGAILTAAPGSSPSGLAGQLEAAAAAAIQAQPASEQAIANSVLGVVTSLAAHDGLAGNASSAAANSTTPMTSAAASTTGLANATSQGNLSSVAITSSATVPISTQPASASASKPTSTNAAPAQQSGLMFGAMLGAVAGLAALL